ncbi:MAG: SUF system Fe-S cluster assembly regulator [Sumerlaeia bacterium]
MLRVTKLTDYGVVLLAHMVADFARGDASEGLSARDLADRSGVPPPTVSKILKALAKGGILASHRGAAGGYRLARAPEAISLAEVVDVLEGPMALTECSEEGGRACFLEDACPSCAMWKRINDEVLAVFRRIDLREVARPLRAKQAKAAAPQPPPPVRAMPPPALPVGRVGLDAPRWMTTIQNV